MASIRRTLSPVPRAGTSLNGEACSVASPLSKSSSCTQNHPPPSTGLLSSLISSSQALILGVSSPRPSRSLERSKPKGQIWRRALFHFLICFVVGVLVGLTSFVSMNLSTNHISKQHAFTYEMVSAVGNLQTYGGTTSNGALLISSEGIKNNATIESRVKEIESIDVLSYDKLANQLIPQASALVNRKLLIIVTPTYARSFQAYHLNRLAHTLWKVQPPLLWIVVEMTSQSEETADILRRTGVMYRHLVCNKNLTDVKDRRVHQRNVALSHIENHRLNGIVYFADDDNIYSSHLFEQLREIRRFGTWTVAKVNKVEAVLEGPICNGTQVIGWHINEPSRRFRRFHAEMPGFAFNSTILWDPKQWHRPTLEPIRQIDTIKDGFQASIFIEQIVEDESQMEGLLENCSTIMVWLLPSESSNSFYPQKWSLKNNLDVIASLTGSP